MQNKGRRKNTRLFILLLCLFMGLALLSPMPAQAAKRTGWKISGSSKYYYVAGRRIRGKWKMINKKWYHFDKKGRMQKKRWVGDYYVGSRGYMLVNRWIKGYFVGEDGRWIPKFQGGWQRIGGKWYYYTKSGKKKTGWITYKNNRYYLNSKGVMTTKWTAIKKKNYYFQSSGELKKNTWVKRGKYYYYVNSRGVMDAKRKMDTKSTDTAAYMEYRSSTLSVKIRKKEKYSSVFWVARIKTSSPRQLRSALSYGTYGGARQLTSQAVPANGGIIGVNGSAFSYETGQPSPSGMCIKNGVLYGNYATSYTTMAVKKDGTMFSPQMGLWGQALLDMGVKDTYNFGPILINNGLPVPLDMKEFPLTSYKDPRTVVGMVRPNDYVILVADGRRSGYSLGLDHYEMIEELQAQGCRYAYNLDGGGSTTLYYDGRVLNHPSDKGMERPCGDFLYFTN